MKYVLNYPILFPQDVFVYNNQFIINFGQDLPSIYQLLDCVNMDIYSKINIVL